MKKIAFSDRYGLTNAVIQGHKTMTRRIIPINLYNQTDWKAVEEGDYEAVVDGDGYYHNIKCCGRYQIGEEVAIAQSYCDIFDEADKGNYFADCYESFRQAQVDDKPGWNNKMFVRANLMPHRIIITDINVERLQDISVKDCISEGIYEDLEGGRTIGYPIGVPFYYTFVGALSKQTKKQLYWTTAKEAFSVLIDRICGRGTWERNPWVFAYSFTLKHENK